MTNLCAACGTKQAFLCIGGTPLCRDCEPDIRAEIETLRAKNKPVNVLHIARKYFRCHQSNAKYLLRDIPVELWQQVKHRAIDDNVGIREVIFKSLYNYLKSEQ